MIRQIEILLPEYGRGFHLVDEHIQRALRPLPDAGFLHLFIQHTSAGLTINENADPDVRTDMRTAFDLLVPDAAAHYTHTAEGPDDMSAHVKATLTGFSVSVPITAGRLALGMWQGIYLCEFRDRPRRRTLLATLIE